MSSIRSIFNGYTKLKSPMDFGDKGPTGDTEGVVGGESCGGGGGTNLGGALFVGGAGAFRLTS